MSGPQQSFGAGRDVDPEQIIIMCLAITAVMTGLAFVLWYNFHTQIAIGLLSFAGVELRIEGLFTHRYDQILANLVHAQPEKVSARTLWTLCTITGKIILLPSLGLFTVLGILCAIKAPRAVYRHKFGLDGMTRMLASIHPVGSAWVGASPRLLPPAPAGKPLRPMDPVLTTGEWLQRYAPGPSGERETVLQAHNALVAQLGQLWTSPEKLTPAELCLFMAFSLYHDRQKDKAQQLLENLSSALSGRWKKGEIRKSVQLDRKFGQKMLTLYRSKTWTNALEIASRHAYVRPALMSLLQEARRKAGVVNPSLFSVIQLVDRDLWLILCALSYPMPSQPIHAIVTTTCTEAAGVTEHWRSECIAEKPCLEPQFAQTLTSLMTFETGTSHAH